MHALINQTLRYCNSSVDNTHLYSMLYLYGSYIPWCIWVNCNKQFNLDDSKIIGCEVLITVKKLIALLLSIYLPWPITRKFCGWGLTIPNMYIYIIDSGVREEHLVLLKPEVWIYQHNTHWIVNIKNRICGWNRVNRKGIAWLIKFCLKSKQ